MVLIQAWLLGVTSTTKPWFSSGVPDLPGVESLSVVAQIDIDVKPNTASSWTIGTLQQLTSAAPSYICSYFEAGMPLLLML